MCHACKKVYEGDFVLRLLSDVGVLRESCG